jgi:NTE family protein
MPRALGMVLSGGGARGLAHVGVLKALREAGLEVEVLSGTSAGAIVAALYAAGHSADEMLDFFVRKSPFRVSKLSLSKPGIFDTAKVVADLLEYFPEDSFEALGRRIYITATDLAEARLEIFSSGRLIPAIVASASLPLVFTPTAVDGRWYSDGGITDNFPVEPLVGRCDAILGVYVSPLQRVERRELRSSLAVSHRAFDIAMYVASKRKFSQCDLVLCPAELARFGTFDTTRYREILEIGYQATRDQMPEIERLVGRDEDSRGG